nr:hypothetical protein [Tanacetum cinerariifolium]
EEGQDEEEDADELYRDVNINLGRELIGVLLSYDNGPSSCVCTNTYSFNHCHHNYYTTSTNSFDDSSEHSLTRSTLFWLVVVHRLKTLEANFSEFTQTNQFAGVVSSIPEIVHRYIDQRMNEEVKVAVQLQSDRLRDEPQKENNEFLKTIDENMQKIIKEQVKEQVKIQVSKILPKIKQTVNEQLEAEVLTQSSNSSKTSYAARNVYKALIEAYESDKIILDTYGDTVTLKRRRDDDDANKDKEPSAGSDRGSKRRKEGKEPESASSPREKATRSVGKSTQGSKSRQMSASESAKTEEPMQTTFELEEPSYPVFEICADDQLIVEPSQHPEWFSQQKKPQLQIVIGIRLCQLPTKAFNRG